MDTDFYATKQHALERAWKLLCEGKYDACQRTLRAMEPEARDCEEFHATWLSTLIFRQRWKETEVYARPLVEKHGGYCRTFHNALINGLCGQGRFCEAKQAVRVAIAHWPSDPHLRAIERSLNRDVREERDNG